MGLKLRAPLNKLQILVCLFIGACGEPKPQTVAAASPTKQSNINEVSVEPLWHSSQCGQQEPGTKIIKTNKELELLTRGNDLNSEALFKLEDFSAQYHLVSVNQGRQASGGYGLELRSQKAPIEDDTVTLSIEFVKPGKDSMQTMALTSPCLLVKLQKGPYNNITVNKLTQFTASLK